MLTLGYDVGPKFKDCVCMPWDGKESPVVSFAEFVGQTESVVIEVPRFQGRQLNQQPLYDTSFQAGYIAGFWQCLHGLDNIYLVPRSVIMQQMGYNARKDGNADSWLLTHLKAVHGLPCGRGTALNSTHARAALACAMWNWKDVRNEQYRHEP